MTIIYFAILDHAEKFSLLRVDSSVERPFNTDCYLVYCSRYVDYESRSTDVFLFLFYRTYGFHQPTRNISTDLSPISSKPKRLVNDPMQLHQHHQPSPHGGSSSLRMGIAPAYSTTKHHRSRAVIKSFSASGLSLIIPSSRGE